MSVKWVFPPSGGGTYQGFNDAGIETFTGARFDSLAREIIQNSLDANVGNTKVTVEFDFVKINRGDFPGADELLKVIQQCLAESKSDKATSFFKNAINVLQAKQIPCLRISDAGTSGLRGDYRNFEGQWHAITKALGVSDKSDPTAGGSYGIGKNAPFAVSALRTVFYSTLYKDDSGDEVTLAQGKSVLVSHLMPNETNSKKRKYTQSTGFYGEPEDCMPIEGNIPQILRPKAQGCVVFIPGFVADKNWWQKVMATVVANFFRAIYDGKLEVLIQNEREDIEVIDRENLGACFDKIKQFDVNKEKVENSRHYYNAMQGQSKDAELNTLGHCRIWLQVEERLPKRVALVRKTGMLITDEQIGFKRWPGCADFAAVVVCDSDEGNAILRKMENPKHDAFEPDRIGDTQERKQGKKALKELKDWVRDHVKQFAMGEEDEVTPIDELSRFFPDLTPEEGIAGDDGERDIEGRPIYSLKPIKNAKPQPAPAHSDDGEEGGGEYGLDANGGGSGGKGDGDGEGAGEGQGVGGTGTKARRKSAQIDNVRIVADAVRSANKTVYFTPQQDGEIQIELGISGDDGNAESVAVVSAARLDGAEVKTVGGQVEIRVEKSADAAASRIALQVKLQTPVNESMVVRAFEKTAVSNDANANQK